MSRLNEINRTAVSAWSPCPGHSHYLALGSISGSLENFSSEAKLEIFKGLDLQKGSKKENDTKPIGTVVSADRFNRLAWGQPNDTFEMGVIAGAMTDGNISLYDPKKIVDGEQETVIATLDKHTAGVRGLEFNPTQHNLLASAGEDSTLYIWNLKNPATPTPISLSGKNPHHDQTISYLSWNRIFEYILATTSYNGTSVVWDLKQKKPIVPIVSAQKRRYSSLAWNPEEPTQLVFACEDDNSPVIELWDLKKAYAPVKELTGHQRGVLSVSWCPDDSNLLVSCGKDNRTLIWNPNSGEVLGELPTHSTNWMYDVQWSRRPSILSAASFDGKIGVFSLQDSSADDTVAQQTGNEFIQSQQPVKKQNVFKTAPKWLQRPCGATFGFGGRIVKFNNANKQARVINVHSVASESEFGQRALALELALGSGKPETIQEYCAKKAAEAGDDEVEKNTWNVLGVLFEGDRTQKLLKHLGLEKSGISDEVTKKLAEEGNDEEQEREPSNVKLGTAQIDELIRRSVMVQNYEDAVKVCLESGRLADALVISTFGGGELYASTRQAYFDRQTRPVMKTVSNILNQRFDEVIKNSELAQWKETLAELCSCPKQDQFQHHCQQLGARLEDENNDISSALICYMLGGNVEKTLSIWLQRYLKLEEEDEKDAEQNNHKSHLIQFIEKVAVFQASSNSSAEVQTKLVQSKPELAQIYTDFSTRLASQGQQLLPLSLHYLNMVVTSGTEVPQKVHALRHRVYNAVAKPTGPKPELPWQLREPKAVAPVQPVQQQPVRKVSNTGFRPPVHVAPQVEQGFQPQPTVGQGGFNQPFQPQPTGFNQPPPHVFTPQQGAFQPQPTGGFNQPQPPTMYTQNAPPTEFNQPPTVYNPHAQIGLPPTNLQQGGFQPQPTTTFVPQPDVIPPPQTTVQPVTRPVVEQKKVVPRSTAPAPTDDKLMAVDTSAIKSQLVPVVEQITQAFNHAFRDDAPSYHKSKKRIVSNSLNDLFQQITDDKVDGPLADDLVKLASMINDQSQAKQVDELIRQISTKYWNQAKEWVKGLKFLIQALKG